MNGIILIDKEKGITSFSAINNVKKILNIKKIGHAGTLDPLATGLLVVMMNSATKLSDYLMNANKEYIAEIFIGKATDTLDSEGVVVEEKKVFELVDVDGVLKSFLGKRTQIPPMYSAIKQEGVKLYSLARKGVEVERNPRDIEIFEIERISDILNINGFVKFSFRVKVSKGTYIRTLSEDIGKALGYPTHLVNLRRTKIGSLDIKDSYTLEQIIKGNYKIISMEEALNDMYKIDVDEKLYKLIINGVQINQDSINTNEEQVVFTYKGKLIGIYVKYNGKYKAKRIWN